MKMENVTVTDSTGATHAAQLVRCDHCDGNVFVVFQVLGMRHFHLQCAQCGESYCPAGCDGIADH